MPLTLDVVITHELAKAISTMGVKPDLTIQNLTILSVTVFTHEPTMKYKTRVPPGVSTTDMLRLNQQDTRFGKMLG
jgi:hypothetical protein